MRPKRLLFLFAYALMACVTVGIVAVACTRATSTPQVLQPEPAATKAGPIAATSTLGGTSGATTAPTAPPPAAGTAAAPSAAASSNPFGLLMAINSPAQQKLLQVLGVGYFRTVNALNIERWDGTCQQCDLALEMGVKLLLTVRNNGGGMGNPTSPPTDLAAYQQVLGEILDTYPPEVLVVENEENSSIFYTGTPSDYAIELKAACAVAHSKGIKCANGGIVSSLTILLTWEDLMKRGDANAACDFAKRAFTIKPQEADVLCNTKSLDSAQRRVTDQLQKGNELLDVYRAADTDYMNFHWYGTDPQALEEAVNFLEQAVGKPVMTNEMGQQNSADPNVIAPMLQKAYDLGLSYIVWYSVDAPQAKALQDENGTLRPNGEAFRQFMQAFNSR